MYIIQLLEKNSHCTYNVVSNLHNYGLSYDILTTEVLWMDYFKNNGSRIKIHFQPGMLKVLRISPFTIECSFQVMEKASSH